MIKNRLQWWLEQHELLSPHQAGFRRERDTTDQCLQLTQTISDNFHAKPSRRTILTQFDYSRAFDTVWRENLYIKMIEIGIPPRFTNFIRGWLVNRRAKVKYQDTYSRMRTFRSGLPQGSVLSPLLFLIYINDALTLFSPNTLVCAFADDLAVACSGNSKMQTQAEMQREVDAVANWSRENRLALNIGKCTCSFFSTAANESNWQPVLNIDNAVIPFEANPVFLGVKYDRLLHFGQHIDYITKKTKERDNIIRSLGGTDSGWQRKHLRTIYIALQRSILEYAGPAWFPWASKTHREKLERCQLRSAKLLTRLTATTPTEAVLYEADLIPLTTRLFRSAKKRCIKWQLLPQTDCSLKILQKTAHMRLKMDDWRNAHAQMARDSIPTHKQHLQPD